MTVELMVSRGHSLNDLLNKYPISTLRDLMRAASQNRKDELASNTQGQAVAILHGLDCGFNKGKQKLLTKFMDTLLGKKKKAKKVSDPKSTQSELFSLFAPRK